MRSIIPEIPSNGFSLDEWQIFADQLKDIERRVSQLPEFNSLSLDASARWPQIRVLRKQSLSCKFVSVTLAENGMKTSRWSWELGVGSFRRFPFLIGPKSNHRVVNSWVLIKNGVDEQMWDEVFGCIQAELRS